MNPPSPNPTKFRKIVAQEIERLLPETLGTEIAITGSTSRGVARQTSDLEINLWSRDCPINSHERLEWLKSELAVLPCHGARDIVFDRTPIADGSLWVTFHFHGLWVELGVQSAAAQESLVGRLSAAQVSDHRLLVVADAIIHALPLRSTGALACWQRHLRRYSDPLQRLLILEAAEAWTFPLHIKSCWETAIANRLTFLDCLLSDLHGVLRILFAINRIWEPDWKRIAYRLKTLPIKPARVEKKIEHLFRAPTTPQARGLLYFLILDTLHLVPPEIDVMRSIITVKQSLKHRHFRTAKG